MRFWASFAMVLVVYATGHAQQTPVSIGATTTMPTRACPHNMAPPDTLIATIYASVAVDGRAAKLPPAKLELLLQEITPFLPTPATFPFPVDSRGVATNEGPHPAREGAFPMYGSVRFTLDTLGRISDPRIDDRRADLDVSVVLAEGLLRADSAGVLAGILWDTNVASVPLMLSIGTSPKDGAVSRPLFRFAMPYRTQRPAMAREGNAVPRYPPDLQARGVEGEVVVSFVVDTSGRADVGTLHVVRSNDPAFTAAVRGVLMGHRFFPAESNGCKMRMSVTMAFNFRISGSSQRTSHSLLGPVVP